MNRIFEWEHEVQPDDIDELGHANNEAYLHWMNAAAVAHSAALGWPTDAYLRLRQGWVVRRHEIEYLRPALPGTALIVRTWVRSVEHASSWRAYRIVTAQRAIVLVRAQTLWAWINYETGRACRIPPEVLCSFPVVTQDPFASGDSS